jgi:hypothetical protein
LRAAVVGLPLVGSEEGLKQEFKIRNQRMRGVRLATEQNQNLPKMENPKLGGAMGLPLVGNGGDVKEEMKILTPPDRVAAEPNQKTKIFPRWKNEKLKPMRASRWSAPKCPQIDRKEARRATRPATRFHDHLVLESKPHFMIILRLENAIVQNHEH